MATLLSRFPPSNTWDFIFINQAPLRTLSHQSKRELVALGRLQRGNTVNLFTPHADTMRTARPSGGLEVRYRLSEFHAYMTSLP